MNEILFYRVDEPYGEFSNFSPHRIFISNQNWSTVEHYFQAQKFNDIRIVNRIMGLESPMAAAKEGRKRMNPIREDWEMIKEEVMLRALQCKFVQHPKLRKLLLGTGDSRIIEHTSNDYYWADGGDGSGKNRLGELLMVVRTGLREMNADPLIVIPPWLAFPTVDYSDMFWRMGLGEDYLNSWRDYLHSTGNEADYRCIFPTPDTWKEVYSG